MEEICTTLPLRIQQLVQSYVIRQRFVLLGCGIPVVFPHATSRTHLRVVTTAIAVFPVSNLVSWELTEVVVICLGCPSYLVLEQLPRHVLLTVPTPRDASHGHLIGAMKPAVGSSQAASPFPLKSMFVALLLSKETSDLIALEMTWQSVL
jgi:hypothetical protein